MFHTFKLPKTGKNFKVPGHHRLCKMVVWGSFALYSSEKTSHPLSPLWCGIIFTLNLSNISGSSYWSLEARIALSPLWCGIIFTLNLSNIYGSSYWSLEAWIALSSSPESTLTMVLWGLLYGLRNLGRLLVRRLYEHLVHIHNFRGTGFSVNHSKFSIFRLLSSSHSEYQGT